VKRKMVEGKEVGSGGDGKGQGLGKRKRGKAWWWWSRMTSREEGTLLAWLGRRSRQEPLLTNM
jgi:hypothetical protein